MKKETLAAGLLAAIAAGSASAAVAERPMSVCKTAVASALAPPALNACVGIVGPDSAASAARPSLTIISTSGPLMAALLADDAFASCGQPVSLFQPGQFCLAGEPLAPFSERSITLPISSEHRVPATFKAAGGVMALSLAALALFAIRPRS